MERKFFTWGQWDELSAELGFKPTKPQEKNKAKTKVQREKFARCRKCGGQMKYLAGTNILICENEVEVEKEITKEDGTTFKKMEKQVCGNVNLVDKEYQGYMRYLFD